MKRDMQHAVIGGVCAGLARQWGMTRPAVRLLFILGFFVFFSLTFWLYILLWILTPDDESNMHNYTFACHKFFE